MWGLGIALFSFREYLGRWRLDRKRKTCDVCGQSFDSIVEAEDHRRKAHADFPPAEAKG